MKMIYYLFILFFFNFSFAQKNEQEKTKINQVLKAWHQAAAHADFETYFNYMSNDAIFIGTDATENWNKEQFMKYAKPHFDKGKAWNFTSLERNIYFSTDGKTAWFDELLDTQMKICRGSGVLIKINKEWKIAHYVLSISIPNDLSGEVIQLKTKIDNELIEKLKS